MAVPFFVWLSFFLNGGPINALATRNTLIGPYKFFGFLTAITVW